MATWQTDGYFVSNGPATPAGYGIYVATVQNIPPPKTFIWYLFGVSALALANGCSTYKMHHEDTEVSINLF